MRAEVSVCVFVWVLEGELANRLGEGAEGPPPHPQPQFQRHLESSPPGLAHSSITLRFIAFFLGRRLGFSFLHSNVLFTTQASALPLLEFC